MKITYDPSVDALYIRIVERPIECEMIQLNERVSINRLLTLDQKSKSLV